MPKEPWTAFNACVEYTLGVDLGTTYTAAAVRRDGRTQVVQLGSRRAEIPSLVFLRDDGAVLVGDAAERRGAREPARLAREFKRRLGDPVPVLVGGSPYPAHALTARVLSHVHETVTRHQEGPPTSVIVTHPANWGPYKRELLMQAMTLADVRDVQLRSEPEAAAVQYAAHERVRVGEVVAVYDLGGGTFDAAVLRKTASGFELLGDPAGIEQLGGIDFDEAVLGHVVETLGPAVDTLDPADPAVVEALAQLRRDCVVAKEDLSADTEVLIPVALPTVHTRVRLNRSEFEDMIRPALQETVAAMHRALRSAGVDTGELRCILLAGGSSRIPLVSELLSVEFGRPLVLDANPEHSIALGAAMGARQPGGVAEPSPSADGPAVVPAAAGADPAGGPEPPTVPVTGPPTVPVTGPPAGPVFAPGAAPVAEPPTVPVPLEPHRRRRGLAAGAAAAAVLLVVGAAWFLTRDRGPGPTTPDVPAAGGAGQWRRVADLPASLEGAAVTAYQDRVWVAGGLSDDEQRTKLTTVFVYDPATDAWSTGPSLPRPISHGSLVATPWNLYFLAGWVQDGGTPQVLKLNATNTAWVPDVPLPEPRVAGAAAFDGSAIVYAGGTRKGGAPTDTVWALRNGAWRSIGKLAAPRQKLAAVGNNVDTVWVLGGRNQQTDTKFGTVDRIAQGRVAPPGRVTIDPPVDSSAAVRLDGIGMCLVGGESPGRTYNDWWCEQPGVAETLPKLDPQRAGMGLARIGQTVYVVGGYGKAFQGTNRVEAFTAPG
jgi:actin-like ATPase involved in cell morphogenesis